MEVVADFAAAVRGIGDSEFTADDAAVSVYMEMAARESALNAGQRIPLPLDRALEADAQEADRLRQIHGVDPSDVDAMLDRAYPRP